MKRCFFVSRIGLEDSPERRISDKLLEHIIKPVVSDMGYSAPERADHIAASGVITTQVFTRLLEDDLVVADLTGSNPNVFYELAVRHMVRKPFVQFIQKGEKIPFDIALNRTLHYDFDVATVDRCRVEFRKMIEWFDSDAKACDTALSLAIDFRDLSRSDNPLEKSSNEILSMLQKILGAVGKNNDIRSEKIEEKEDFVPSLGSGK